MITNTPNGTRAAIYVTTGQRQECVTFTAPHVSSEQTMNRLALHLTAASSFAVFLGVCASAQTQTGPTSARRETATTPRESAEAAALRAQAMKGDVIAQANLGVLYSTGRGVPQD